MKQLAVYYRVSTKKQARGHSLDAQETAVKRFFAAQGWTYPTSSDVYIDHESGRRDNRTNFTRMLDNIRSGALGGFVVHTWDRFFRDLFKSLVVYRELQSLGAQAWAADDPYNIFSFDGEERFKQDMLAAEGFSRRLSKHVRKGKQQKAESGDGNAPRPAFGWRRVNGKIVQTDDAAIVERAARLYLTGSYACSQVARLISTPERAFRGHQVYMWLRNPWIAGRITYLPTYFGRGADGKPARLGDRLRATLPGTHEGVITWEEFERIQGILHEQARGGRGVHHRTKAYVYGKKLCQCAHCGRNLSAYAKRGESYYACSAYQRGMACETKTRGISETTLNEQMTALIGAIVVPDEWIAEVLPRAVELAAPEVRRDSERADLEREREQAIADMSADRITPKEFTRRLADIKKRLAILTTTRQEVAVSRVREMAEALHHLPMLWEAGEAEDRRQLVRGLFRSLVVDVVAKRIVSVTAIDDETAAILRGCQGLTERSRGVFALRGVE